MTRIAYYRVSTGAQSIEAQRTALDGPFDREFCDEGISGGTPAAGRPGFKAMMEYVREGDALHVFAIDRLGRDAIDVQNTVRVLLKKGVTLHVLGLGIIAAGVGELIVAVLAQIAQMERDAIKERTSAGRVTAREMLATTGLTQHGKSSLGRPKACDPKAVQAWREANGASLSDAAKHFSVSLSTVKRYLAPSSEPLGSKRELRGAQPDHGDVSPNGRPSLRFEDARSFQADGATDSGRHPAAPVLLHPPMPISSGEESIQTVVALPPLHHPLEIVVSEVDTPLPIDLHEGAPVCAAQDVSEAVEQTIAVDRGNVEPRRVEPKLRRRANTGLPTKGSGRNLPVRSVVAVDDQMPLPFDDPQGGFGK